MLFRQSIGRQRKIHFCFQFISHLTLAEFHSHSGDAICIKDRKWYMMASPQSNGGWDLSLAFEAWHSLLRLIVWQHKHMLWGNWDFCLAELQLKPFVRWLKIKKMWHSKEALFPNNGRMCIISVNSANYVLLKRNYLFAFIDNNLCKGCLSPVTSLSIIFRGSKWHKGRHFRIFPVLI